jgi:hypothetical protein
MENMLTTLQENAKKILNSVLDLLNTAAEAVVNVAGQGAKTALEKGKEFVEENRKAVTIAVGVVAGVVALAVILKLLCRKKK